MRPSAFQITPGAPKFFSPQVAEARRFYLDLNAPRQGRLAIVCGGVEHCQPDYAIHRANFPFYTIEYVARGRGELKIKRRVETLHAGRIFSYGPGVPHAISSQPDDPLVKYFVNFTGKNASRLLRSHGLVAGQISQVFPPNALLPLFDELIQSGLHVGRGNPQLCTTLLECLVMKFASATAPLDGAEKIAFGTYQQCRRYIEQHFSRLRTLEQIAGECHVSDAYLCRLFRRYDRQTPYQYLLRLKMNRAADQLQRAGMLVKQAAEEAGFHDPFHFSRVFRKVLGLTPADFRNLR